MASSEKCERRRLAEHGTFYIDLCNCGVVHLTIGCLTLRLDPSAYRELASSVQESLCWLDLGDKPTMQ